MSMALALQFSAEWLRERYGFNQRQCGVQFDSLPPNDADLFYIALDDGGIEAGSDSTASLRETLNITVGIWRKPEHLLLNDKRGGLQEAYDKYLMGAYTLHDLERKLIVNNYANKLYGLHHNFEFIQKLNLRWGLPHTEDGDVFNTPLFYRGRGRMEFIGVETGNVVNDQTSVQPWFGMRLRFRGLMREQVVNNLNRYLG